MSPRDTVGMPGERYRLLKRVGAGGAGEVYLAEDQTLGVLRALKLLFQPRHAGASTLRKRFLSEARILARLQHPNLVPVYDVGEHRGRVYFVMEFAERGTLRQWARRDVEPWDAGRVVAQVLSGLEHAHAHGVVHRDVKPANILVFDNDRFRLGDFGVARFKDDHRDDLTRTGDYLGTIGYMAPEQRVDPRTVTARSDLYAVGVTLFCLLTRAPRGPPDLYAVDLDRDFPEVPGPFREVVGRATQIAPAARYASAAAMREAVDRAVAATRR